MGGDTAPLLPASYSAFRRPNEVSLSRVILLFFLVVLPMFFLSELELPSFEVPWGHEDYGELCPQVGALHPQVHHELAQNLSALCDSQNFVETAAGWLGGAVRVATESFDAMGEIGVDPRWEAFADLQIYLNEVFPAVHETLLLTKINTYGLYYKWQGTDPSLKPILLVAHQDTVPVDPRTIDRWTHPPWSGLYDGEWIWGRGSVDDKSGLIGILSSIENLINSGFEPARTIVLSFGFDEEVSGTRGAQALSEYLLSQYGVDGFAMLIDEGGKMADAYGATFALPAVGEKGYLDIRIEVATKGGHSSIPPPHTGIGLLSSFLVNIEADPVPPHLNRQTPIYETIKCIGQHAPDISPSLRRAIKRSTTNNRALRDVEKGLFASNPIIKATVSTTQAIDLISGGMKTNALPELSWAIVNNRIGTESSVRVVQERFTKLIAPIASEANLTLTAFGRKVLNQTVEPWAAAGDVVLSDAWGTALEPAPVTPTDEGAVPYRLLSGTILAVEKASEQLGRETKKVFVAPSVMSGNTDTRYYWKLTRHIFRYSHGHAEDMREIHTIDERIRATAFAKMIKFYSLLILNADESREL